MKGGQKPKVIRIELCCRIRYRKKTERYGLVVAGRPDIFRLLKLLVGWIRVLTSEGTGILWNGEHVA